MRYLVIVQRDVTYGEVFGPEDFEGSCCPPDPEDRHHQEVEQVVPCDDTRVICKVVVDAGLRGRNWSVWEVTPKGVEQRAITFKFDGKVPYDVEVH